MKACHVDIKSSLMSLIKSRLAWVFLIVSFATILIPSGLALANYNEGHDENTISVAGTITVYYKFDKDLPSVCVVGWDNKGDFYRSTPITTGKDGKYNLTDIPDNITGLIEVTSDQCKTGFKVLPQESKTNVDFYLPRGAKGPFNDSADLDYYVIKAGSSYTDEDGATLTFNKDLKLLQNGTKYLPSQAFCFADDSHLIPDHTKGYLIYTYDGSVVSSKENINVTITCAGKNNKYFTNFVIKDRVRQWDYHVHQSNSTVPIYPVFTSENTMVVAGNLREFDPGTEEILNHDPYVYAIWYDWKTDKFGYKYATIAPPDENAGANYGILDVPINAVGAVVGGASGYAMDVGTFFYWDDDHPETHAPNLNVPEGAKVNIQYGEGFEKVVLAAGTQILFNGESDPFILEEDVDLGNDFPPFGLLLNTKITFNSDGTANYIYEPGHPEEHEVSYANFIFKAIPKVGYNFGSWALNGVTTTGDYTITTKDDITIVPVINKNPGPQPGPTPVINPTGTPSTGDGIVAGIILAIIAVSAYTAASIYKRKQN